MEVQWKLKDIPITVKANGNTFYLRRVVVFSGPERSNLSLSTGHYIAYCYRPNDRWEIYDDLCKKVITTSKNKSANVEVLIYSL